MLWREVGGGRVLCTKAKGGLVRGLFLGRVGPGHHEVVKLRQQPPSNEMRAGGSISPGGSSGEQKVSWASAVAAATLADAFAPFPTLVLPPPPLSISRHPLSVPLDPPLFDGAMGS